MRQLQDNRLSPDAIAHETGMVIPADRLPPGFAQSIGAHVEHPAEPGPAATAVLMRDGDRGVEILLLKRHRSSGFVPGAYVFAGGRVDTADSDPALLEGVADAPGEPPAEYWTAAIREVFEESGVLLARDEQGNPPASASADVTIAKWRDALMADGATLRDVLTNLGLKPDFDALAYAAHWITPVAEARRYDTRFFHAALPPGCEATADAREMSDAVWLTAKEALERFRAGRLPMVFPTVKTLEGLSSYRTVAEAMAAARATIVKPILPTLVRVGNGVGIVIDADAHRTSSSADRVSNKDEKSD